MKALIFNSGLGSRLGKLTAKNPKAMVKLGNGETVLGRQLRILYACGIREFVITTGPHADQLVAEAAPYVCKGCKISFVPNPIYDKTNYIYSMNLAREQLAFGDWLVLHGDLVFDADYAQSVLDEKVCSLGSVNRAIPLPEKDFKARVVDGEVEEVSVDIFDEGCFAFQPFYKLSRESMEIWLREVFSFCESGDVNVYAENAANRVFGQMHVAEFSYEGHFVEEVDTPEDLKRVSTAIRDFDFVQQPIFEMEDDVLSFVGGSAIGSLRKSLTLGDVITSFEIKNPLVVVSRDVDASASSFLAGIDYVAAPFECGGAGITYEEVMLGVRAYQLYGCDGVVSIGGDAAVDAAKCIKLFAAMPAGAEAHYAEGNYAYSGIAHVCISAAGLESPYSCKACCLVDGSRASVEHDCLQPSVVVRGLV